MLNMNAIRRLAAVAAMLVGAAAWAAPVDDMRHAVEFDDVKAAQKMLARGVDPNLVDAKGNPMLVVALREKSLKVAEALIRAKDIDFDKTNAAGETPLMMASLQNELDHAAYIDAESPNGTTPLMMAARGGHIETVKLLLDEGADMRLKNQQGMTVIDFAERYHQKEIAQGLKSRWQKLYPQTPLSAQPPQKGWN